MPSAADILQNLATIAQGALAVAVAWHVIVAALGLALAAGYRPSTRLSAVLACAPLASVAVLAWLFENPFNGAVFTLASLGLPLLALRGAAAEPVQSARGWARTSGLALLAYAWVYPHFLGPRSAAAYLLGAPLGVIPCPSLALVVSAALLGGGLVGGAWRLALAGLAGFYALFGVARLGVLLDVGLLAGVLALLVPPHGIDAAQDA